MVRTQPSQGWNRGPIPRSVTSVLGTHLQLFKYRA